MGTFIRENWLWIALPLVLILVAIGVLLLTDNSSTGGNGEFHYDLF